MSRKIETRWADQHTVALLNQLIDKDTLPVAYRQVMYDLGTSFGKILLTSVAADKSVSVACTVEDADYLTKGLVDVLEPNRKTFVTVFWNKRFKPNVENGLSVAPILKEYHDLGYTNGKILVITKSIISSSCVVRTNLIRLMEDINPEVIFIVAPVLKNGAIDKLQSEFPPHIIDKFQFIYFSIDDALDAEGMVQPGIGGDVYKRLGYGGQDSKNKTIPLIVKERRNRVAL